MNPQRRTHRAGPVPMTDAAGNEHGVFCETTERREQFLDGTWGEWVVTRRRFYCSASPVNKLDDGSFELASTGTPIRPRSAQA